MESKYLYLWINILSFIVPFLFSFYPKANFSKKWRYVLPAILVTAVIFIAWDAAFTAMGVWWFNPKYVSGIYLLGLPLEEILFFFCIPYACLFTYFAFSHLVERDHLFPHQELISSLLIVALLIFGSYYMDRWYTAVTFLFTGAFLALILLKLRVRFMGRFYFAFAFLLVPFLIVNGILTGSLTPEPVVWYDDAENIGVRIGTIPLEDAVYALLMILIPITIWEKLEERSTYR